jgi:hypothetical protein
MKSSLLLQITMEVLLAGALMIVALSATSTQAQVVDPSQTPDASVPAGQRQRAPDDSWTEEKKRELVKKQNEHRQQDIKQDTDKLLELATELKHYVDKSNENIISLDVIKKAEQIEKLAKSVKDKMKGQ